MSIEPDSGVQMPQTSYQQQYARMARLDDAAPLGPNYKDIADEMAYLDANAAAHGVMQRYVYNPDAAER